ncbi:MAG: DUF432 domain-containing protein [Acidobacteria bacterium]|nr:DUF432 domain-containing protein [Acidobacteriota bacterium]
MFGKHTVPFVLEFEGAVVSVQPENGHLIYRRQGESGVLEKNLLHHGKPIHILPVEPVNLPKNITPFLMIEFDRPIFLGSKIEETVYVSFPYEIGVFISARKPYEVIDIFSFATQKYTLYGEPKSGLVCRYWKSAVFSKEPELFPLREGIIHLTIKNTTADWVEIRKVVLNAFGMKIYYDKKRVVQSAHMKIVGPRSAETDLLVSPFSRAMNKSIELFSLRKQIISTTHVMMRDGI